MAGMFGIGLSGLNTAQAHLSTISHNITNAATPGFSRQTVIQLANDAEYGGAGFFGRGVQIGNVTRAYNQFLEQQVQNTTTRQAQFAAYSGQISQINNLLADPAVGLTPVMNGFFEAVQDVVANPTSVPARQALLSASEDVAGRFRSMDARMDEVARSTDGEIAFNVERINTVAIQIAELNQRIALAQSSGGGVQANDLQDLRNNLLVELNTVIAARAVPSGDGQLNVYIGTGQALVLGGSRSQVTTMADPNNAQRLRVGIETPSGATVLVPEDTLTNGALGGLLDFRREALDTTRRQFDLLARSFIEEVNRLHRAGVDLDGLPGGDLFGSSMVRGQNGASNPPDIEITNDRLLTNDSYRLTYGAGGTFELVRVGDTQPLDPATIGLAISVPADAQAGEEYLITPLAGSARSISVLISDPARFAAGQPQATTTVNTATVSVTPPSGPVTPSLSLASSQFDANGPALASFTIRFDGSLNELIIDPAVGYTLAPDAAYDTSGPVDPLTGKSFTLTTPTGESFDFTLAGQPADGDEFGFDFAVTSQTFDVAAPTALPNLDAASTASLSLPTGFEANGPTLASFTISFDGTLNELVLPGGYVLESGDPLQPDSAYDPAGPDAAGKTFTLTTPTGESFDFTLSGVPVDGDEFELLFTVAPVTEYTSTPSVTPSLTYIAPSLSVTNSVFESNGAMAPFALRFDGVLNQLVIDPATGYSIAPDADYDTSGPVDPSVGKTFTVTTPTGESIEFTLAGQLSDGEEFAFEFAVAVDETITSTGPGDNRNAVAIGALQTLKVMLHSATGTETATFQSAYSQLVSFVGNKTREVQTAEKAQAALLQQARDARESFSGVNLDEEAANLVRYQQAYQAAGRVMTVAQRLFDEVLTFGR